jgi:predicted lipoprotein
MKKILLSTLLLVGVSFAQNSMNSILKNVSIPNVDNSIKNAKVLQEDFNKKNFTVLVKSWKKVEALYFAGDINEDYIDTPRYIDVYHNLKENLSKQMQRVIDSKDEPRIALFKNSFRTINALEYVLFNDETITSREKVLAKAILDSIISNLEEIKEVYTNYLAKTPKEEKWENAVIINTLIASSYRLREWRIGEPSGNATKYKGSIKNSRAEYFLSKNSFVSISAILEAHNTVMGNQNFYNFANMASTAGAEKPVLEVQEALKVLKKELRTLKKEDFSKASDLYQKARVLHNAYFLSLIEELSVTAKILDADGD